ncbi:hypothetical protein EG327_011494, partial [Venturia inaequalis]
MNVELCKANQGGTFAVEKFATGKTNIVLQEGLPEGASCRMDADLPRRDRNLCPREDLRVMQAIQVIDKVDGENEQGPQNYKMQYDKIPGYIAEGTKEGVH